MGKIDIHVHTRIPKIQECVSKLKVGGSYATPEELCNMYDTIGIEKGVILPSASPASGHYANTN